MYSELNGDKFESYTTIQGDFWSTISTRAYGRPNNFKPIIESNPGVPLTRRLPGGIKLKVPVIPPPPDFTDLEKLPPWKRELTPAAIEGKAAVATLNPKVVSGGGSFDKSFD